MPRAYRPMKAEGNPPHPVVGDSAIKLGVRPADLKADAAGNAPPGLGGMSVVSSLGGLRRRIAKRKFSPNMVPERLNDSGKVPGAMGPNSLHVFRIGEGAFERGSLTEQLTLVSDRDDHGTMQPARIMPYDEYRQAIIDTRDQWVSGEEDHDS